MLVKQLGKVFAKEKTKSYLKHVSTHQKYLGLPLFINIKLNNLYTTVVDTIYFHALSKTGAKH